MLIIWQNKNYLYLKQLDSIEPWNQWSTSVSVKYVDQAAVWRKAAVCGNFPTDLSAYVI